MGAGEGRGTTQIQQESCMYWCLSFRHLLRPYHSVLEHPTPPLGCWDGTITLAHQIQALAVIASQRLLIDVHPLSLSNKEGPS